ncbi:MAG TPA: hypothetical protein VE913_13165 [Longimicrobium sp.]|nr:hypothetical protein [Longimicrobium sp.]
MAATSAPRLHHQHLGRYGFQGDARTILVTDGVMTGVADPRRGGAAVGIAQLRAVVQ